MRRALRRLGGAASLVALAGCGTHAPASCFGCASAANLAALSAASPAATPRHAGRRDAVVAAWVSGRATTATRSPDERARIAQSGGN